MPTTRVPAFRCGTDWPAGWLVGSDPTMEDDEVHKTFCFSNRNSSCKYYEKYKIKDIKRKKNQETKGKKSEILIFWTNRSPFRTNSNKITSKTDR